MIKYLISFISIAIVIYPTEKLFEGNALALLKDSSMLGIPLILIKPAPFVHDKELHNYKNLLRTNIQQIIKENDQVINDLANTLPNDNFWNYLIKTVQEKPLSMLQECHGESCSLSRFNSPGPRDDAQKTIVELIKKHYPHKATTLIYTSFCSGELLTDAKILDELIQEGYTSIHINIIDIIYEGYIERVLKEQRDNLPWKITPQKGIDWNKIGFTDDLLIKSAACTTLRIYQLLTLLDTAHTNITVTLYAHVDDYLTDCNYDNHLKSDIIVAIDCIRTAFNAQSYAKDDLKKAQETYLAQQKEFPEEEQKHFLEETTNKYTAECIQEAAIVEQDFIKLCDHGVKLLNYAVIKVTQEHNIPYAVISYIIESGKPSISNFGIWIFEHSQALFQYIPK